MPDSYFQGEILRQVSSLQRADPLLAWAKAAERVLSRKSDELYILEASERKKQCKDTEEINKKLTELMQYKKMAAEVKDRLEKLEKMIDEVNMRVAASNNTSSNQNANSFDELKGKVEKLEIMMEGKAERVIGDYGSNLNPGSILQIEERVGNLEKIFQDKREITCSSSETASLENLDLNSLLKRLKEVKAEEEKLAVEKSDLKEKLLQSLQLIKDL